MTPCYKNFDMSIVKDVRIQGRQNIQFRIDMLNMFDNVNFIRKSA